MSKLFKEFNITQASLSIMMKQAKKMGRTLKKSWGDQSFVRGIHHIENLVAKILSVALILVIAVSIVDLIIVLITDLLFMGSPRFFTKSLIEIFGLFLNILIALELLENITAYLRKHILHVELVVVTALIAVARKIIIFDTTKFDKSDLMSLAIAIFALSVSYWLIHRINKKE